MQKLLKHVGGFLHPLGYRRRNTSFWKIEGGFYRLIDLQRGAHGGEYFFVNVCFHPVGLPELQTKTLSIIDHPKEYECIIRQRIEQVVKDQRIQAFKRGPVAVDDPVVLKALQDTLPNEVEHWLVEWASFSKLASAPEEEIIKMLSSTPKLQPKAILLLRFYCHLRLNQMNGACEALRQFLNTEIVGLSFPHVDEHLRSLCAVPSVETPSG